MAAITIYAPFLLLGGASPLLAACGDGIIGGLEPARGDLAGGDWAGGDLLHGPGDQGLQPGDRFDSDPMTGGCQGIGVDLDGDDYGAGCPAGPDCNDDDPSLFQVLAGFVDGDSDGVGTGAQQGVCSGASLPRGWAPIGGDCDDDDASVTTCGISCDQALDAISLTIKEVAGVGAVGFPVTTVIPVPAGACRDHESFGMSVPAQTEPLNHWIGRDGSVRHLAVHFQASVGANADAPYTVTPGAAPAAPPEPVTVLDAGARIEVNTGALKFYMHKNAFTIIDELFYDRDNDGVYAAGERVIAPSGERGATFVGRTAADTQRDVDLGAPTITVEEDGPMRVVIRAEVPTAYNDADNDGDAQEAGEHHRHGFAVRIYAYAGAAFIKVDYQLQNSAKGPALHRPPDRVTYCTPTSHPEFDCGYADPLYFDELRLTWPLQMGDNPTVRVGQGTGSVFARARGPGLGLRQTRHDQYAIMDADGMTQLASGATADGFIEISDGTVGVFAAVRNFWEMWPNGIAVDGSNNLRVELFPPWSAMWHDQQLSPSGLYWLDDLGHVYKEVLLSFNDGTATDTELIALARTFHYPPVPVLPLGWLRQAQATLDLGGVVPLDDYIDTGDRRQPDYSTLCWGLALDPTNACYNMGWNNFLVDIGRKLACSSTGGWPDPKTWFFATGQPADFYMAEATALGELNVRPQWMAQYEHDRDWVALGLTQAPYAGGDWRAQHDSANYDVPGTGKNACARDDQHAWFYHVESFYWMSANSWVKDWLHFSGEFRKPRLVSWELFPDGSSRATAHALSQALAAARANDDPELLAMVGDYVAATLRARQSPTTGIHGDGGTPPRSDWAGGAGFLARQVINFMHDVDGASDTAWAEAFLYVSGVMSWNLEYGNFDYWIDEGLVGSSSGTGLPMVDPQAWYYAHTGLTPFWDELDTFIASGLPAGVGEAAYGDFGAWEGQWEGRYRQELQRQPLTGTRPPAISDLAATATGSQINLTWTTPPGTARLLALWCERPIVGTANNSDTVCNWWAAQVAGVPPAPLSGQQQRLVFNASGAAHVYAALLVFDARHQMSPLSNVAQAW